jgi:hypothetical protein
MRASLVWLGTLGGCCERAWNAYPMDAEPDWQCRTGTEAGYDLYGWDCTTDPDDGEERHVVVYAWTASFSCKKAEKETAACGELTQIEEDEASSLGEHCEEPPDSMQWD